MIVSFLREKLAWHGRETYANCVSGRMTPLIDNAAADLYLFFVTADRRRSWLSVDGRYISSMAQEDGGGRVEEVALMWAEERTKRKIAQR